MNNIYSEYGPQVPACLKPEQPKCPFTAVIPAITVEDKTGLKNLSACLVHVANINTTFYIDDKHRMMITWAGPVEVNGYDFIANPLGLRSQMAIDYEEGQAAYYNAVGEMRLIPLNTLLL